MSLTEQQIERYSRHIILPEVGGKGQEKLLTARVLLVGAGGLGCPAGLYLAAAGVGTIGIMDADRVDLTNLQRQIAHATPDLGRFKADSATAKFQAINPDVTVRCYRERLQAANAPAILADYDFIIDGTDNFPSKFLVADACHFARKPYSHAGILRFEGQTMTVRPGETTCYRCIFSAPPPPGAVPSCSQAGVLGVLAGVVGCIQATEAIKFLLGIGELLTNKLLVYHALKMKFREVALRRNRQCPLCGEAPSITELRDEAAPTCDLKSTKNNNPPRPTATPPQEGNRGVLIPSTGGVAAAADGVGKLAISKEVFASMLAAARAAAPLEACGLLAGAADRVTKFYPMTNLDASSEHFSMKPEEQFAAAKDMRQSGLRLLAIWHSHPATPPRMSAEDLRLAFTPEVAYVILSLATEPPLMGACRVRDGVAEQIEVRIDERN